MSLVSGIVFQGKAFKTPMNMSAPVATVVDRSRYHNHLDTDTDVTMSQLASGLWVGDYNGTTSYVEGTSLEFPKFEAITMLIWAKPTFTYADGVDRLLVTIYDGTLDNLLTIAKSDFNVWVFGEYTGGTTRDTDIDDSSLVGGWHQFGMRGSDGNAVEAIIDGVVYAGTPTLLFGTMGDNPTVCNLGSGNFQGQLEHAPIVTSYAMTDTQIAAHYNKKCRDFGREPI